MKNTPQKYQDLFQASLELFAAYGYKKTTVDDVAKRLSMTKGNLYFYVKNKRDLYEKTINYALIQWKNTVEQRLLQEEDLVARFRMMALASIEYIENNPLLRQVLMNDPSIFTLSSDEDRFRETNINAMNIIKDILAQGIREKIFYPVDVDHVTEYLFSVYIMFLIKRYMKSDKNSSDTMFREALELTIRGLVMNPKPWQDSGQ
ncbi:MAG: TetR/AcrR family transcriptional regulator [Proteobacteria bacterium]|nr:TetR/AcrR family transcriptional regulator [Pseudomonadota bacterium]